MKKIIRITTVPSSLKGLLRGQLKYMSQYFEVIGISSNGDELKHVEEEEGVKTYSVQMSRKISPFQDMMSMIRLYFIFKKEKPAIVHTHTPKAGTAGMMAAYLARVPLRLHTVAGLPLMEAVGNKRKILNIVEKITYKCATNIYPNSLGLYNFIVSNQFVSQNKLKLIGQGSSNGINVSFFNPDLFSVEDNTNLKKEIGILESDFVFVFVGRIVGDKGINELVNAFAQLARKNIKLLLVGPFEEELDPLQKNTHDEIQRNPNIISIGFQKDVRPYLSISDALVFPSYREGFPNVVMQAGAMGLPSIVSDINGCNEIIVQNENGLIIPVKDTVKLQRAMIEIIDSPNEYDKMKSNARKMIADRYEQSVVWKALLDEYNILLNEKK